MLQLNLTHQNFYLVSGFSLGPEFQESLTLGPKFSRVRMKFPIVRMKFPGVKKIIWLTWTDVVEKTLFSIFYVLYLSSDNRQGNISSYVQIL